MPLMEGEVDLPYMLWEQRFGGGVARQGMASAAAEAHVLSAHKQVVHTCRWHIQGYLNPKT